MVNVNSANIYHIVAEVLPQLSVLDKVLRRFDGIPVAFRTFQTNKSEDIIRAWLNLIGWPLENLNIKHLEHQKLFFARKLIMPLKGVCGQASANFLQQFRARFRLSVSTDGTRATVPSGSNQRRGTIVFGRRPEGKPRFLIEEPAILVALSSEFPNYEVISFWGNLTLDATPGVFKEAALYLGVHGAGMTNMIFMPAGAAVLEMRPDQYTVPCYHFLAERCGLNYHVVEGQGSKVTPLTVNVTGVMNIIRGILVKTV